MKISYNWLKEHLDFNLSPEELSEILTSTGLEVESFEKTESIKGGLEGLVIAQVLEKEKHPDADKLSITKVDAGTGEIFTIVCGASNVATGQKVVVALPGTTIFPMNGESFKIKKAKIRGVESCGMICAEDEIGLGQDHNGIIVLPEETKVGILARDYYQVKSDYVFEIGLTPNRIDAASHRGVARDLRAALIQRKKLNPELSSLDFKLKESGVKPIEVRIENSEACLRYSSVLIKNVTVKDSPNWLKQKLNTIGIRSINNVVDITNYVLHDLGQPLHAFDADELKGNKVIVRNGKLGNTFTTLDGVERKLDGTELMICDEEKELCIAGIFGGDKSGVSEKTKNIFLESAWFHPGSVRKTAKKFGLNTDASFRFERGADINLAIPALKKAAQLIAEIGQGEIGSAISDIYPAPLKETEINISLGSINRLVGKTLEKETVKNILQSLDIEILNENGDNLLVKIPLYRVDVIREQDVTEEILRIYGYNEIGLPEKMSSSISYSNKPDHDLMVEKIADFLSANGYHEIMTNSLTTSSQMEVFNSGKSKTEAVKILNPLSTELDILRVGLLLNGLQSIAYNLNRQQYDLKFYEFGKVYSKENNDYKESYHLSLFLTGRKEEENWNVNTQNVSIYSITSVVEALFSKLGLSEKIEKLKGEHSLLTNVIEYSIGKSVVGVIGEVNKSSMKFADIKQKVYSAEINWDVIMLALKKVKVQFSELPKFPSVRRDLSLLLDEKVRFSEIETLVRKAKPDWIKNVGLFDVYEGKNLEAGKKSYAINIQLYNSEATLTDPEVEKVMNEIISSLDKNLGAKLR
jgi:phenylalanyl-tRNA synthetase beta chain